MSAADVLQSDPELLARFRAGERRALSDVYRCYAATVARTLRSGWRAEAAQEVDDLLQEVFLKAFAPAARRAYDARRPYGPYLRAVARNTATERARRARWEIPTAFPPAPGAASADPTGDDPSGCPAAVDIVARMASQLPAVERALYEERFTRGRSQRATAARLGLSRQNVRTLEDRIRARVTAALAAAGHPGLCGCRAAHCAPCP